jgi:prepilin-type N-terminal cleavage/methylation domain-containing protein
MNPSCKKNFAFSLVELSVVLVILGLLTGGVLTGQSLIRASQLNRVIADLDKYKTAIYIFEDKYFSFPGDMTNATQFWGVAHATPATCKITASTGKETCNGDGDRAVYPYSATSNEGFRRVSFLATFSKCRNN